MSGGSRVTGDRPLDGQAREATRPSELEEVLRENLFHSLNVETSLLPPELPFETLEDFTIVVAELHGGGALYT